MYILTIQESFKNLIPKSETKIGFEINKLFKPNTLEDIFNYGHLVVEQDNSYDYLGFENGNFIYCQHSRLKNGGFEKNKIFTPNIQGVLQHIINSSEHKGRFKEKDFFNFNNKLLAKMGDNLTLHFPSNKEEILEAFNYTNNVNTIAINSCANFNLKNSGWEKPDVSWYEFYYNNLDKIQLVVVKDEKGVIQGRSYFFHGNQEIDTKVYGKKEIKKGTYFKFFNSVYGLPVAQAKIREFFKSEGIVQSSEGCFVLKINFCKKFPPVDSLVVDEEKGYICTMNPYNNNNYLPSAYKYISKIKK